MIFTKSRYSELLEEFGVPKYTLWSTLDVIFLTLKYSSMKHLWDLIVVGKITNKTVRELITHKAVKNRPGPKIYLLKDKEA